ncbi:enoyl-CoA hydratase-related protein [Cupriavidus basilensis]|uniref:Enoyl-CoA hydratase n=1 Tax=Cupriavidus basilensis TaxID=68895 RepID=A0A0C4YF33_9BURK|nr:enoyl-CoA hydratase-related protein [Cupriavidus basilensis]AJG24382.1 Enoyl-CoA hydratase [Cupriavidus basilensis]
MSDFVQIVRDDGIAVITLNHPHTRNAIADESCIQAIVTALAEISADPALRVAVLTGAGPAFCAGGSLQSLGQLAAGEPIANEERYRNGIQRIPRAFQQLDIPMIAAVNGPAIGAGLDLACMCDIRIASTRATFAESFVKLGLVAGDGGAWLLARTLPLARAYEMALTGNAIGAQQALEWGLVSRLAEPETLMDAALTLAGAIAANPGHAVRMTKRLVDASQLNTLDSVLNLCASMQALAHTTEAHRQALRLMTEHMRSKS